MCFLTEQSDLTVQSCQGVVLYMLCVAPCFMVSKYRLDAESRELRVVVSRGPRAVAHRAQRVRATRGPEAHYNA